MKDFPCTSCGLCCQNIGSIEELKAYDLGNGVCKFYDGALKQCSIYESRPLCCKVKESYEKIYFKEFSRFSFYQANAEICNKLQEHFKIDEKFRILDFIEKDK